MIFYCLNAAFWALTVPLVDYTGGGPNWAGAVGFQVVAAILLGLRFAP